MRKTMFFAVVLGVVLAAASSVAVAQTATQDVTVVVQPTNAISVSGSAVSLTVFADNAPVTDNSTTMDYSTNGTGLRITAALDVDYATGITLGVEITPGGGEGTTAGPVTLSTTAVDVVTGISNVNATAVPITYTATADATAAPNGAGETHTVTFTITT